MSTNYSANQYESAFKSQKLQNWTIPKQSKEVGKSMGSLFQDAILFPPQDLFAKRMGQRPSAAEGYTAFIATDRGHLLPGVRTKRNSAWPEFQGTWDLPRHIPPVSINPTARSQEGQNRLRTWGKMTIATKQEYRTPGVSQTINRNSHSVENINVESKSQSETERPKSQHSQEHSRPASQLAQSNPENLHEIQVQSRMESHHSQQAQSRPATQQSQAETRPPTQNSRPASQQK